MPAFDQALGNRAAHLAQSRDADFHIRSCLTAANK
jgi:hypothetical protein